VKEAYRVLKQGGRFAYNHDGPHDSLLTTIFDKVFSKYSTKEPSETLRREREASELQRNLYSRYRDPFVALASMRDAGFKGVEARIAYHPHRFSSVENFIDSWFYLGQEELGVSRDAPQRQGCNGERASERLSALLVGRRFHGRV